MKRRNWVIFTAIILVIGIAAGAAAASLVSDIRAQLRKDFVIAVDGEVKEFKNANGERVYPILYEGTTYLPIRAIGELMGKTVYWYQGENRIELKEENYTVTDAGVIVPADTQAENKPQTPRNNKPTVDTSEFIGENEALDIALRHAGLAKTAVRTEKNRLEKDDGVWRYEIEFRLGTTEYDYEIKADDGRILDFDIDIED